MKEILKFLGIRSKKKSPEGDQKANKAEVYQSGIKEHEAGLRSWQNFRIPTIQRYQEEVRSKKSADSYDVAGESRMIKNTFSEGETDSGAILFQTLMQDFVTELKSLEDQKRQGQGNSSDIDRQITQLHYNQERALAEALEGANKQVSIHENNLKHYKSLLASINSSVPKHSE